MKKRDLGVFLTKLDGVVEVAVAGRENDGVTGIDQALHAAFDFCCLRDRLESGGRHAGNRRFDLLAADIHGHVVSIVGGWADIDESDFLVAGL